MSVFVDGKELFKGLVVAKYEYNGPNDSDFYAVIFDGETSFEYCYASTFSGNFWGSATVDASPEWQEKYRRHVEFERLIKFRRRMIELAEGTGLHWTYISKLYKAYGNTDRLSAIIRLLKTKRFRSAFRKDIAEKIRAWVLEENPRYRYPISARQLSSIYNGYY